MEQLHRTKNYSTNSIMRRRSTFSRILMSALLFLLLPLSLLLWSFRGTTEWKIGFIGPLSGDYANYGRLHMQSIELAIQEFTEQYGQIGGRDIRLIVKDSMAQGRLAAEAASELIQKEQIIALVGPVFSSEALAIATDFQNAQTPMIAVATNPHLTNHGNYIFRTIASDALVAEVLAISLSHNPQPPDLGIIYTAENAFSQSLAESVAGFYEELGGKVLLSIGTPAGTTDFSRYLDQLAPLSPAAIFLPLYPVELNHILAQLRGDTRLKDALVIGADSIINQDFLDAAGDMAEGIIAAADAPVFSDKTRYFEALYKVLFGTKPDIYAQYLYDGATILLHAMQKVYQTHRKISAAALREEIDIAVHNGTVGKITFDENGDANRNVAIFKVRAKNFEKEEVYAFHYGKMRRVE